MARSSVGLDIGTRAVRLAEIQTTSGHPTLSRFGRILLPLGAVEHGEIQDPFAVGSAIATLWKRLGLTGRSVHIGISNRRVIVRVIELPAMAPEDLAGAIRFQAQEHIPIPLDEAVMDFEIVSEVESPEGERLQRVLVVAAERTTVEPLMAAVTAANLEAATLELNAYPLVRCFGFQSQETEAIVDVGAGVTNVVVHQGGKIRFTRILPTFGGDEFTNAVVQGLGVDRDDAESLKRRASILLSERAQEPVSMPVGAESSFAPGGEDLPMDPAGAYEPEHVEYDDPGQYMPAGARPGVPSAAFDPDYEQVNHAVSIIEPLVDRFVTEVRGSIDFYSSQVGAAPISHVVLTGGGSLMGGIAEHLSAALGLYVEYGRPFDRVPIAGVDVSPEERAVAEPFIGVAVGLALAEMDS